MGQREVGGDAGSSRERMQVGGFGCLSALQGRPWDPVMRKAVKLINAVLKEDVQKPRTGFHSQENSPTKLV